MNDTLKQKLKDLPHRPGVYFHKDIRGDIIYVGKAAVLRNRVRQYFQSSKTMDVKTLALVAEIVDTDWVEVESEIDALFLESEMVKRYMPRYNVLLRDDKSQMYVRIDMKSEWPTVSFTRNPMDDKAEYFGPFYNGYALKKALRYLRRIFPYYTKQQKSTDSKLNMQIGLHPDKTDGSANYKATLRQLISYIKGNRVLIAKELEKAMKKAADLHQYEKAAHLRNQLNAMKELQRRVMFGDREFINIEKDKALSQLKDLLQMDHEPRRLECFDISHHAGSSAVASMVVFTNGVTDRSSYRKFKVDDKNDDPSNIRQTIRRRLNVNNLQQWGKPDLIIVDGGKSQLNSAIAAMKESGQQYPVVGFAKQNEEMIVSLEGSNIDTSYLQKMADAKDQSFSVRHSGDFYIISFLSNHYKTSSHAKNLRSFIDSNDAVSPIVYLMQRIRDESHRFAISYHSAVSVKKSLKSQLDDIDGIGPKTKQKLIKHFGSISKIIEAPIVELQECIGNDKAQKIIAWKSGIKHG